jgi:Uma2 family endonuclease
VQEKGDIKMTIALSKSKFYTPEEYLTLEIESEVRNEYRNGEIVTMTGGTPAHNQIISALNALLWFGLRRKPYSLFVTDQRLWIPDCNLYTYPDGMVIKNPVELKPGRKDTVMNPLLILEVLSDSTKDYDKSKKFSAYQTLPTFQEYLLIDQAQVQIEQYVKQPDDQWFLTKYNDINVKILLDCINLEIALVDIYENLSFL